MFLHYHFSVALHLIFMLTFKVKIVAFFILLLGSKSLLAQKDFFQNTSIGMNGHYGWNLPEYQFLSYYSTDYVSGIEVNLTKEATGKNFWEKLYKYPSCGLSFFYSTLGNDDTFGREAALTYFFKIDLIRKEKFKFYNRTGIGLGYVNRTFDFNTNYRNVAVGSGLNVHFNMRWGADYTLTDHLEANLGFSFDHFSNANTAEPNLGINTLTGYMGLNYNLKQKTEKIDAPLPPHIRQNTAALFLSVGGKSTRTLSSAYFLTSSLSFELDRSVRRALHLGVGADLFYDSSQETQLSDKGLNYKPINDFQTGIHFSQTLRYRRVSLSLQQGFYIILKEKIENKPMYNRGIIKYRIGEKMWIRLAMKSHLVVLDYPEIGFGIKL